MGFKFTPIFKIRIVYTTGYVHDFWCYSFIIRSTGCTWKPVDISNKPIDMYHSREQVVAIWQVGTRRKLQWIKKGSP